MLNRLKTLPSPALVIAFIALVAALGTGSAVALSGKNTVAADDITPIPAEDAAAEAAPPAVEADQFAETNSGRVSVASKPGATTKLPMFIGDGYGTTEKGSSFGR